MNMSDTMDEKELPKTIAGYQSVCYGNCWPGDIWVRDGVPNGFVDPDWYGQAIPKPYHGFSVYRKLKVAKQGTS